MVDELIIRNVNKNKSIRLDMNSAQYLIYPGSIDWGTVQVTNNTYKYPNQIGETFSNSTIGKRDISISGWIVGTYQEMKFKKRELNSLIVVGDTIEVVIESEGRYISCVPSTNVKYSNSESENNECMCKFLIQFESSFPVFQKTSPNVSLLSNVYGMFSFPLIVKRQGIPLSVRKKSLFTDIINDGVIDVGMYIKLTAIGTVNYPMIQNIITQEFIKINKIMQFGEEIIIDTRGVKKVTGKIGNVEEDYMPLLDFDSTFLVARMGINTLTYKTFSDGNTTQDDTYKNLNIEIKTQDALYDLEDA